MGLPVVSTWHGGIPELVEDGVSGLLVPDCDEAALAERLACLVNHPETWPVDVPIGDLVAAGLPAVLRLSILELLRRRPPPRAVHLPRLRAAGQPIQQALRATDAGAGDVPTHLARQPLASRCHGAGDPDESVPVHGAARPQPRRRSAPARTGAHRLASRSRRDRPARRLSHPREPPRSRVPIGSVRILGARPASGRYRVTPRLRPPSAV